MTGLVNMTFGARSSEYAAWLNGSSGKRSCYLKTTNSSEEKKLHFMFPVWLQDTSVTPKCILTHGARGVGWNSSQRSPSGGGILSQNPHSWRNWKQNITLWWPGRWEEGDPDWSFQSVILTLWKGWFYNFMVLASAKIYVAGPTLLEAWNNFCL